MSVINITCRISSFHFDTQKLNLKDVKHDVIRHRAAVITHRVCLFVCVYVCVCAYVCVCVCVGVCV